MCARAITLRLFLPALICLVAAGSIIADSTNVLDSAQIQMERYPFMNNFGRVWSLESEFDWPKGYRRPDSSDLADFQYWISYIPLWHKDKEVSSYFKGRIFKKEEISRTVQLQWRVMKLTDYGIPIQLLAEYYWSIGRRDEFTFKPAFGKQFNYLEFRSGRVIFRPREGTLIEPTSKRPHTEVEYNKMVDLLVRESNYASLAANCESIEEKDLAPGDLLIAQDSTGRKGRCWMILNVLTNKKGKRLFVIGTGCPKSCAFYIPLFNNNRRYPWIDLETLKELASDFKKSGFYRLPIPESESK